MKTSNNLLLSVYFLALTSLLTQVFAAPGDTPAGTLIQNQASATYRVVGDSELRTTTSNVVATLVQQVAGLTLVQDRSKPGAAGYDVTFPHVLTNTGNGPDTYALSVANLASDQYDFTNIQLFADINHDGQPDDLSTPISSSIPLAQEESYHFVVVATLPTGMNAGDAGQLTVTATSNFDNAQSESNTDTATVTDDAIIEVTKAMSANEGYSPSGNYTVTLTYENLSPNPATALVLSDVLPAGMTYEGNTVWSIDPGRTLTDANEDSQGIAPNTITLCAYDPSCINPAQFTATISNVDAGTAGTVSFEVSIDNGLDAQTLLNTAQYSYNDGSGTTATTDTNTVPFDVLQSYGVVINGSTSSNINGTDEPVTIANASQGATVSFDNIVWNLANGEDAFDISIDTAGHNFPPGTTFQLFKSDGLTPLLDTNGNGIPDTGLLDASGGTNDNYTVVVKAILPVGASGTGAYDVTITATSSADDTQSDTIIDRLQTISASSVDLTNNQVAANGVPGFGAGPEASAQTTLAIAPGDSDAFLLYVNNTSSISDSYTLAFSSTTNFSPADDLPANWQLNFHVDGGNNDCSTLGADTTQTGVINPGNAQLICAVVSIPTEAAANATPQSVYFRVVSNATGASDTKHDAVTITDQPALVITPDNMGQVEPGNSIVYAHTISNNGNTTVEGITLTASNNTAEWNSALYLDVNGDGQLDAGDVPYTTQTLAAGANVKVLNKVFSPATAPEGAQNVTTLQLDGFVDDGNPATITGAALSGSVQDTTTVSRQNVSITKEQALDTNCNGTANGPAACTGDACFTFDTFPAATQECVIYRLTATNRGADTAHNVRIDDMAPIFTTIFTGGGYPTVTAGFGTATISGDQVTAGGTGINLLPGESMELLFEVRLD